MSASTEKAQVLKGAEWLVKESSPFETFIPEDYNEEQQMVKDMCNAFLDAEVKAVERLIAQQALSWPEIRRLMTVPGVNLICAATFIAAGNKLAALF